MASSSSISATSSLSGISCTLGDGQRDCDCRTIAPAVNAQLTAMRLGYRAAEREPDAKAIGLARMQRRWSVSTESRRKARAAIADAEPHELRLPALCDDPYLARGTIRPGDGLCGIADEVDEDLLDLKPVSHDGRQIAAHLYLQCDIQRLEVRA